MKKLEVDLKSLLEIILQTTAYPKMAICFQLHLVTPTNDGFQLFAACANACIALSNKAGLNQMVAPVTAMTLCIKEDGDRFEVAQNDLGQNTDIIDVVFGEGLEIVYLETVESRGGGLSDVMGALMSAESELTASAKKLISINYAQ